MQIQCCCFSFFKSIGSPGIKGHGGWGLKKRPRNLKSRKEEVGDLLEIENPHAQCIAYLPTKLGSFGGFHVGKYTIH